MSLGRKQRISNEAWLDAVATIESAVSRDQMEELTAATVEDIRATVEGKRAAYAWSAGKDSIVLGHICEIAGVTDSMIGVCDLEYPAFAAWVQENKPAGCEVINTHQNMDWLGGKGQLHRLLPCQYGREGLLHPAFPDVRLGRQYPYSDVLEQAG